MHTYSIFFRILKVIYFLLLVRPGIKLEIVLARLNLELVPGMGAENLSAIVQGFSYLSKLGSRGRLIWEKQLAIIPDWENWTRETKQSVLL